MSYIAREDGAHLVIPSYRDVLVVKQLAQLKKEIVSLSQSYGEYITLQKKGTMQYEVAFSTETGYLLGESVWHHFNKPTDMIYCESIPNTTEAILVIVKAGSVYLDGSFPQDSIPEELTIFLTQKNNFEVYIYGDVPISQEPEEGKFSFDSEAIKSFTILDEPVFSSLALLKNYQLRLVNTVLKSEGIGVLPLKQLIAAGAVLSMILLGYLYLTSEKTTEYIQTSMKYNPYQAFINELKVPPADKEIHAVVGYLNVLLTMPGWALKDIQYQNGKLSAQVLSQGGNMETLLAWARHSGFNVLLKTQGILLTTNIKIVERLPHDKIYAIHDLLSVFIDKLGVIYPGNHIKMGEFITNNNYIDVVFSILLQDMSPMLLDTIGEQFHNLPFILQSITIKVEPSTNHLSGTINMEAVGRAL